jgi:hypothetical protein
MHKVKGSKDHLRVQLRIICGCSVLSQTACKNSCIALVDNFLSETDRHERHDINRILERLSGEESFNILYYMLSLRKSLEDDFFYSKARKVEQVIEELWGGSTSAAMKDIAGFFKSIF